MRRCGPWVFEANSMLGSHCLTPATVLEKKLRCQIVHCAAYWILLIQSKCKGVLKSTVWQSSYYWLFLFFCYWWTMPKGNIYLHALIGSKYPFKGVFRQLEIRIATTCPNHTPRRRYCNEVFKFDGNLNEVSRVHVVIRVIQPKKGFVFLCNV